MSLVHISTWQYSLAVAGCFTLVEALKPYGNRNVDEDDQINCADQGLSPAHARARENPSLRLVLPFPDQTNTILNWPLGGERWISWHPVEIINIYLRNGEVAG